MTPTKMKTVKRLKANDVIRVEAVLKSSKKPMKVGELRAATGIAAARMGSILANLRQRAGLSYVAGEGYLRDKSPRPSRKGYAEPQIVRNPAPVVKIDGMAEPNRDSVQTRGPLLYSGVGSPVRTGASDHKKIPSRIGDVLVYIDGK